MLKLFHIGFYLNRYTYISVGSLLGILYTIMFIFDVEKSLYPAMFYIVSLLTLLILNISRKTEESFQIKLLSLPISRVSYLNYYFLLNGIVLYGFLFIAEILMRKGDHSIVKDLIHVLPLFHFLIWSSNLKFFLKFGKLTETIIGIILILYFSSIAFFDAKNLALEHSYFILTLSFTIFVLSYFYARIRFQKISL